MTEYTDKDVFNFLKGFANKETKQEITMKYIQGLISKEEYIKKMNKFKGWKVEQLGLSGKPGKSYKKV